MLNAFIRGTLGKDPAAYEAGQTTVVRLRVADYSPAGANSNNGQARESVWVDVEVWDDHAQRVRDLFRSGDPVLINGRWETTSWTTDDGQRRTKNFVRATAIGPDLSRCNVRQLTRVSRTSTEAPETGQQVSSADSATPTAEPASNGDQPATTPTTTPAATTTATTDPFDEE